MNSMSYIEKLLDRGEVELIQIGKIAEIKRGTSITKKKVTPGDIPVIAGGRTPAYYHDESNREGQTIVIAGSGAYAGFVSWWEQPIFVSDAFTVKPHDCLIPKYCFYWLQSMQQQIHELKSGGGVPHVYPRNVAPLEIPIPCAENPEKSLQIQAEIVRILDAFTSLTAELTAELTARKKQYNYYRDKLLSFEDGEVERITLMNACDYVDYRGKTPVKTNDGVFLVTAKNIRMGYIDYETSQEFISPDDYSTVMRRGIPKLGDVLITTEAPCGFVAQVDRDDIALAQRVIKYRSKNNKRLSNSFIKHYLLGGEFQKKLRRAATGSTVKGIKGSKLHQLTIPIPKPEEQARIVTILDKFDALTNSITEGLPREIELRQKQYEYYRDLLLSFPKPDEQAA
ncbi:restriction endonuclease subunit S [Pseudidiomarina gelatinasegens]|uniref:restriction endonuclease subunit S n=1 Tax=Pseudidiomarina gelatinasegens TaxID=2487740 RepID=UPI003A986902